MFPSLVGVTLFLVFPLGVVIWLATQEWGLIGQPRFVGFDKIIQVLGDPAFLNSLLVTLGLAAIVVPVQTALGLLLAALLEPRLRRSAVFRTILLLPWVAAPLALGVVWRWIFAPTGGLISTLVGYRVELLVDPVAAPFIVAALLIWSNTGFVALFYAVGISMIPRELVDAARLDGAGSFAILRRIVVPLLGPTTLFVIVTSTATVFATFDQVYSLTGGGPGDSTDVLAMHIFTAAFETFDLGAAAVMALVMLILLAALSVVQWRSFQPRRWQT
ncbi:sugar ABC transporter permease [Microbacterium sp. NPDC077644]|uniref:carbohydrate ABC transporter permease n=1 Tax=Microbacterium sp. NPDC077644 TaxID=3155055 RepID=UPI00344C0641